MIPTNQLLLQQIGQILWLYTSKALLIIQTNRYHAKKLGVTLSGLSELNTLDNGCLDTNPPNDFNS